MQTVHDQRWRAHAGPVPWTHFLFAGGRAQWKGASANRHTHTHECPEEESGRAPPHNHHSLSLSLSGIRLFVCPHCFSQIKSREQKAIFVRETRAREPHSNGGHDPQPASASQTSFFPPPHILRDPRTNACSLPHANKHCGQTKKGGKEPGREAIGRRPVCAPKFSVVVCTVRTE